MPEIWVPYGETEILVTIQAENLQDVFDSKAEGGPSEVPELPQRATVYVLDRCSPTIEFLNKAADKILKAEGNVRTQEPEILQKKVPSLKERISRMEPVAKVNEDGRVSFVREKEESALLVSTVLPDSVFGILEPRVHASLELVEGGPAFVHKEWSELPQTPLQFNENYRRAVDLWSQIGFGVVGLIPSSGHISKMLGEREIEDVGSYIKPTLASEVRAAIISLGGSGYDDDLTRACRHVWNAVACTKEGGSIAMISECSNGLGSKAMEMYVTGRIRQEQIKRMKYIHGIESVYLFNELKERYDVFLLSGLPDVYVRKRLGVNSVISSKEAVNRLIGRMQRSGKLSVVVRASELYLKPAQP